MSSTQNEIAEVKIPIYILNQLMTPQVVEAIHLF